MKTQNLKLKIATLIVGVSTTYMSMALGIHQSELALACSGVLKVTGIKSQAIHGDFYDRAGNYHPASGYSTFKLELESEDESCGELEEKLGVDLGAVTFATSKSYKVSTLEQLAPLAAAEIGKTYKFNTEQFFGFGDGKGNLPFYPLLSEQRINFKSEIPIASNLTVSPVKSFLTEEEKLELSEAIFVFLKVSDYSEPKSSLLYELIEKHPNFQSNFKDYLKKLLQVFEVYENKKASSEFFDFPLSTLASGIIKLTHTYPEYYEFDLPTLISAHPSLLMQTQLPNISAIDLEESLGLIEEKFKNKEYPAKLKDNFKEPLKKIAGHYGFGGALSNLSSQKSRDLAKAILAAHY